MVSPQLVFLNLNIGTLLGQGLGGLGTKDAGLGLGNNDSVLFLLL